MYCSSLFRFALVGVLVLAGTGLAQAQHLTPEEAEELGFETAVERASGQPVATAGGDLQVCVDNVLLIVDSAADGVDIHDPTTGDLVIDNFIADPANLGTPRSAIPNFDGDGIFVSDQIDDGVFEYDCDGNFVGVFAPAGGIDNTILDNVRGMDYSPDGTELWVSNGSGPNEDTIARFDQDGNYLGNLFPNGANGLESPFDVLVRNSDVLVADFLGDPIFSYGFDGTYNGIFAAGDDALGHDGPQQLNLAANGNVLVGGFSSPSGAYEYDGATGAQVGYYDVAGGATGVYELPNGNLLITNSGGVSEITRSNTIVREDFADGNQYIEFFPAIETDPIGFDADPESQSVSRGGQASFTYTVVNNTLGAQSGVIFYEVFRNGNQVIGAQQVQSGTLQAGQSVSSGFSVNVPNAAPEGLYTVLISVGTSLGNAFVTDEVEVTVTAPARIAGGTATAWTLAWAEPWGELGAAATAAPSEVAVYPNPLRDQTTLTFALGEAADVRFTVYDLLGRTIAVLTDGTVEAGTHTATFDARGLAAGTYVYRLQTGDTVRTGRLTVVD